MKLSQILYKQHIGRQIRSQWYRYGKRTPLDTNAEKYLASKGIEVIDPEELLKPKIKPFDFSTITPLVTPPIPEDETHPDWKDRPCYTYEDNDLLVTGFNQAQVLTKTIVFDNSLPDSVEAVTQDLKSETHELVQRIVKTSVIFDAHQELLPKIKDPKRPAWNFPRDLGITDVRKVSNLNKKFIQLCDCIAGPEIANSRNIIDNTLLRISLEKEFNLLQLSLTMDVTLMSEKPLRPGDDINKDYSTIQLPDLHPMNFLVGLTEKNIYKFEQLYPLISGYHKKNIHTIFICHDKTKVKNKTELPSTETQIFGRAMMKAFTAAASSAMQRFGSDVKDLSEPVTVQCIYSDGKAFYFSVYQLNTLNLDGVNGVRNYYWTLPKLNLYEDAGYREGKPTLEGYNQEVFKRIFAFYKNN